MLSIITRKLAKSLGRKHYFTGKPCMRGHYMGRYVSTGSCVKCTDIYKKEAIYALNHHVVKVEVYHHEDVETVKQFVQALNLARQLSIGD